MMIFSIGSLRFPCLPKLDAEADEGRIPGLPVSVLSTSAQRSRRERASICPDPPGRRLVLVALMAATLGWHARGHADHPKELVGRWKLDRVALMDSAPVVVAKMKRAGKKPVSVSYRRFLLSRCRARLDLQPLGSASLVVKNMDGKCSYSGRWAFRNKLRFRWKKGRGNAMKGRHPDSACPPFPLILRNGRIRSCEARVCSSLPFSSRAPGRLGSELVEVGGHLTLDLFFTQLRTQAGEVDCQRLELAFLAIDCSAGGGFFCLGGWFVRRNDEDETDRAERRGGGDNQHEPAPALSPGPTWHRHGAGCLSDRWMWACRSTGDGAATLPAESVRWGGDSPAFAAGLMDRCAASRTERRVAAERCPTGATVHPLLG